jgi:hypothetical protein
MTDLKKTMTAPTTQKSWSKGAIEEVREGIIEVTILKWSVRLRLAGRKWHKPKIKAKQGTKAYSLAFLASNPDYTVFLLRELMRYWRYFGPDFPTNVAPLKVITRGFDDPIANSDIEVAKSLSSLIRTLCHLLTWQ